MTFCGPAWWEDVDPSWDVRDNLGFPYLTASVGVTCLHCQQTGHVASNCPDVVDRAWERQWYFAQGYPVDQGGAGR